MRFRDSFRDSLLRSFLIVAIAFSLVAAFNHVTTAYAAFQQKHNGEHSAKLYAPQYEVMGTRSMTYEQLSALDPQVSSGQWTVWVNVPPEGIASLHLRLPACEKKIQIIPQEREGDVILLHCELMKVYALAPNPKEIQ